MTNTDSAISDPRPEETSTLPPSVKVLTLGEKEVFLVGTAHVSKQSVADVRATIEAVRPDEVCVELDSGRYQNLMDAERWKKTNIAEVIRKGKAALLLSSLIMTSFQRRIGQKLGVMPGAELVEAIHAAEAVGARTTLIDRDIQVTLKRTWGGLGLFSKFKMATQLAASIFVTEEIDEETVEALKEEEKLGDVLQMLAEEFPSLKGSLIDERDLYLAENLRRATGKRIVAVVGAGHVPGILTAIDKPHDLTPLDQTPPPSRLGQVLKWAIPGAIIALFVYGFWAGGIEKSMGSVYIWFLVNGILSALGAAIAFGHPLTILSAFVAAPLTSLNPMIAAGWVSGLVQAFVKKPTVQDLEGLPEAINSAKGFWLNPVSRILLVVILSNLGSVAGTFIAGSWIAARILG